MTLTTAHMITLADDSSVGTHDYGSNHRIGLGILPAITSQLNTTSHEFFVLCHILMSVYSLMFIVYR
jgi:hypothetical protein